MNKTYFKSVILMGLLCFCGCSTLQKSDSAKLQGTWKGQEIGGQASGWTSLIVTGNNLEFRGANPGEWYKATFTLREDTVPRQVVATITDCPFPQYQGKVTHAIYRLDGDTLTFSGNEPGRPEVPTAFDAPDARHFVLKR